MALQVNVPGNATCIYFDAGRGRKGYYYLWQKAVPCNDYVEIKWFWSCLGNCGSEETAQDATDAARDWIKFGYTIPR